MTGQDLLDAGYQRHPPGIKEGADALFQKPVTTTKGTQLYFVNVYLWDFSKYGHGGPKEFTCEEMFRTRAGQEFHVNLRRVKSPEAAEAFLAQMFKSMDCVPYDHWE